MLHNEFFPSEYKLNNEHIFSHDCLASAYVTEIFNWWGDGSLNKCLIPAERCRSLNSMKDIILELDGSSGHKKPPRKGRKISQATNGSILLLNILVIR